MTGRATLGAHTMQVATSLTTAAMLGSALEALCERDQPPSPFLSFRSDQILWSQTANVDPDLQDELSSSPVLLLALKLRPNNVLSPASKLDRIPAGRTRHAYAYAMHAPRPRPVALLRC